jgi:hypothetical protein
LTEIREAATGEGLTLPAAIDDVRLHDLRRTVGSWLAQAGNSLHLIGRVLNHSNASTTQVYARFGEDSVRAALEQHGNLILGAAGLPLSANAAGGAPQSGHCGTCVFFAEDWSNAPSGGCMAPRSPYFKKVRPADGDACRRYIRDDEMLDQENRVTGA